MFWFTLKNLNVFLEMDLESDKRDLKNLLDDFSNSLLFVETNKLKGCVGGFRRYDTSE